MLIVFNNPLRKASASTARVTDDKDSASVETTPGAPLSEAEPQVKAKVLGLFNPDPCVGDTEFDSRLFGKILDVQPHDLAR